jgi:xanthine dehydrogenase YagT iron-sulfur-binding subunit
MTAGGDRKRSIPPASRYGTGHASFLPGGDVAFADPQHDQEQDAMTQDASPSVCRRAVLAVGGAGLGGFDAHPAAAAAAAPGSRAGGDPAPAGLPTTLKVNGEERRLALDPRVTLLDALREHLRLTGSKKGCDHGQCGACTVLVNGRRINSCLTLAVMHEGDEVTTIEGLGQPGALHPMQAAFVKHDGFQCGYCTPGQICSSVAVLEEIKAGIPSHVTTDLENVAFSDEEVRERMSGNICRCAAYPNIIDAIRDVRESGE